MAQLHDDFPGFGNLIGVGGTKNPSVDQRELAAYTAVANVILNLDETITRE